MRSRLAWALFGLSVLVAAAAFALWVVTRSFDVSGVLDGADSGAIVASIARTLTSSERRIPDAILAAAAEQAGCDWIATFDAGFVSPTVPSRLI